MEDIRLLVQEEGRTARNLIAFNVPVIETHCDQGKVMRKPPTSPRAHLEFKHEEATRQSKRTCDTSQSGSRVRSASTGRDKKSELHARYWAFLFGNLQRAVDEIYQTCESDESVTECKEVIMVLDNYTREFRNLIDWFKIKWEYENTPPPQRPRSLAWEIRKSSPGKIRPSILLEPSPSRETYKDRFNGVGKISTNEMGAPRCDVLVSVQEDDITKSADALKPYSQDTNKEDTLNQNDLVPVSKSTDIEEEVTPTHNLDKSRDFLKVTETPETIVTNSVISLNEKLVQLAPSSDILMVDEVCQTDREEDVDENGPKYRNSGQQTCPVLSGLEECQIDINKNLLENSKSESDCSKSVRKSDNLGKPITSVEMIDGSVPSKVENSVTWKTMTSGSVKIHTGTPQSLSSSKITNKSLFSCMAANQVKSRPSNSSGKINVLSKTVKPLVSPSRPGTASVVERQPWGARPISATASKHPVSNTTSSLNRWTRSKTASEVKSGDKTSDLSKLAAKSNRYTPVSKQIQEATKQVKDVNQIKKHLTPFTISTASYLVESVNQGITNSAETLASDKAKEVEEDDGWVKVRSRNRFSPATKADNLETTLSRSACNLKIKLDQKDKLNGSVKMSPKTRFDQPSSAVSLPTLALLDDDSKENIAERSMENEVIRNHRNRIKIEAKSKAKENQKPVRKTEKCRVSDVNNKCKGCDRGNKRNLNEKKLIGIKESNNLLTERNENIKNRTGGRFQGKAILIDQDGMDEDENQFDEEIKKNKETEEMLQKEIHELQSTEVDVETGDEETDGETATGTEEEHERNGGAGDTTLTVLSGVSTSIKEHRYEKILNGMTWADHQDTLDELEKLVVEDCSSQGLTKDEQKDTLERLEELVARHPGRALELHQKLSSPSRRRTIPDTVKRFQARQAKASEKREQLKMEKAQKLRELLKKVDEVKAAKDKLIEDRRQRLEMKLKKAAENRNLHLKEIMRKAHDEEEKLKEIAFINELEAQNKRHDFMTQCQEQEGRLQGIHEERQRKQEEKAAKEAAVEERRKALEAERQVKLEKMQERQRKRDEQADKKKQEKEKERQELAREKARDRSERLEALHAAQLEAQEELQKKIQQKQEEYARRHEENIEQIRQKALELSILKCSDDVAPKLAPYETQKLCTACNVLIASEVYLLSHLRGRKHQEAVKNQNGGKDMTKEEIERYNIKIIVNAPADKIDSKLVLDKERAKTFKKKCKKIRTRMNARGEEYLSKLGNEAVPDSQNKVKLKKCLKDIARIMDGQGKGRWSDNAVTALERAMGEVRRTFDKEDLQDMEVFRTLNGFSILCDILHLDIDIPQEVAPYLPQKCYVTACNTFLAAVNNSVSNSKFIVASNKVATLLDLLLKHLAGLVPEDPVLPSCSSPSLLPVDPIANAAMRVIAKILSLHGTDLSDDEIQRLQDVISYTVSVGIVDKLSRYCKAVRDPIDGDTAVANFFLSTVEFLTMVTARCKTVRKGNEDATQLLATLQVTELIGTLSILYGMLLHQGSPSRLTEPVPPALPSHTISVALATIRLLRSVAELDLKIFQSILGAEGISLQFRHISSYLLWYCSQGKDKDLLHEVVAVVGYFAVQNHDNQMILQSGSMPTVLQQLCNLPFPYFSNPDLSALLYPTLLACCSDNEENRAILEQEISYSLLEDFLESNSSENHPLLSLIPRKRGK